VTLSRERCRGTLQSHNNSEEGSEKLTKTKPKQMCGGMVSDIILNDECYWSVWKIYCLINIIVENGNAARVGKFLSPPCPLRRATWSLWDLFVHYFCV